MKKSFLLGAILLSMSPAVARADEAEAKASYLKKADREIQEWNAKVEQLQKRSENAGAQTRVELDQEITRVREKLDVARKKLADLEGAGESRWKGFRRGTEEALRDVKNAYRRTVHYFKQKGQ